MLATAHQNQISHNAGNQELDTRLDYLRSKFETQIVMEEWAEKHGQSVAAKFAARTGLAWANIGTPNEKRFQTYTGPINFPGHDGPHANWDAPRMDEYGPFENQEAREDRMVANARAEMEKYQAGLLIVGVAHTHSMFGKLQSAKFKVLAFSWL